MLRKFKWVIFYTNMFMFIVFRNWNNQNNVLTQNLVNFWTNLIGYLIKWPVILSVIIIYISQVLKQVKNVSFFTYQIYINFLILTVLPSTILRIAVHFFYEYRPLYLSLGPKGCKQIYEYKQNRFFYVIFYSQFFVRYYQRYQNLAFG